jgi:hypothetical protein
MSCGPTAGKFRLLDFWVGWSEASAPVNLCGLDDEDGLHLCAEDSDTVGAAVWDYLLPPRLARGCGHCDWYLLTPGPSRLLRRGACSPAWQPLWTPACDAARMVRPAAIAAHQHQLAVADPGAGVILVWNRDGAVLQAEIAFPDATAVGFTVCGDLLAAGGGQLQRFDRSGNRLGAALALPGEASVVAGDPASRRSARSVFACISKTAGVYPPSIAGTGLAGRWRMMRSAPCRPRVCTAAGRSTRWHSTAACRAAAGTGCSSMPTSRPGPRSR